MCYCGCQYENRNGGCNKPANKICPETLDDWDKKEEGEDDGTDSECDNCLNRRTTSFTVSPAIWNSCFSARIVGIKLTPGILQKLS